MNVYCNDEPDVVATHWMLAGTNVWCAVNVQEQEHNQGELVLPIHTTPTFGLLMYSEYGEQRAEHVNGWGEDLCETLRQNGVKNPDNVAAAVVGMLEQKRYVLLPLDSVIAAMFSHATITPKPSVSQRIARHLRKNDV